MRADYQAYYDALAAKGIREYDTYLARVKATTSKGCWPEVEGLQNDVFVRAGYPFSSELQISFTIRPKSRKYYPIVETVVHHGFDKNEHQTLSAPA